MVTTIGWLLIAVGSLSLGLGGLVGAALVGSAFVFGLLVAVGWLLVATVGRLLVSTVGRLLITVRWLLLLDGLGGSVRWLLVAAVGRLLITVRRLLLLDGLNGSIRWLLVAVGWLVWALVARNLRGLIWLLLNLDRLVDGSLIVLFTALGSEALLGLVLSVNAVETVKATNLGISLEVTTTSKSTKVLFVSSLFLVEALDTINVTEVSDTGSLKAVISVSDFERVESTERSLETKFAGIVAVVLAVVKASGTIEALKAANSSLEALKFTLGTLASEALEFLGTLTSETLKVLRSLTSEAIDLGALTSEALELKVGLSAANTLDASNNIELANVTSGGSNASANIEFAATIATESTDINTTGLAEFKTLRSADAEVEADKALSETGSALINKTLGTKTIDASERVKAWDTVTTVRSWGVVDASGTVGSWGVVDASRTVGSGSVVDTSRTIGSGRVVAIGGTVGSGRVVAIGGTVRSGRAVTIITEVRSGSVVDSGGAIGSSTTVAN